MAKGELLQLRELEAYELIDASATLMKPIHRRYGQYAKRIAEIIKQVVGPDKLNWQVWWTIATRCFSFIYSGYDEFVYAGLARLLARAGGVDEDKAEELVKRLAASMGRVIGEKGKTAPASEGLL
jgi:hypothetical protein